MATHYSILAWRIPWTEEPGRLWRCKVSDTTEATGDTQHLVKWTPSPASRFCFIFDMVEGKWRILQGAKGHSQVTDSDDGSPSMGHGTPRKENRCWESSFRFCHGGTFPTWQSVGNFRDWRSQCEEARRHGLTYLKEMKSKACQTKC